MKRMLTFLALLILTLSTPAYSLNEDAEQQHKTKLIRYLVNKVSWPAGSVPRSRFNVCVLGDPGDIKIVEKLNGLKIKKHKLVVKDISGYDKAASCQLVYVLNKTTPEQQTLIKKYAKAPVLLLGDMEHFANLGGSMNFVVLKNTVALTVNLESMKRSKLILDSKELDQVILLPDEKDLE
ncbi:MAG: YfiR family protein [Candidatus Berkiella sp.]